jgi:hypothetical protein
LGRQYRTREGTITAVDTRTALSTLASATAESPAAPPVPAGATKLVGVITAFAPDFSSAGSASFFVRLEGDGIPGGPYVIAAGAAGNNLSTGGQAAIPGKFHKTDLEVKPPNGITISAEMVGVTLGTAEVGVTLVFT